MIPHVNRHENRRELPEIDKNDSKRRRMMKSGQNPSQFQSARNRAELSMEFP
jgi:hypothetical protein